MSVDHSPLLFCASIVYGFFMVKFNLFPHLNNVYNTERCYSMKGKCTHIAHYPISEKYMCYSIFTQMFIYVYTYIYKAIYKYTYIFFGRLFWEGLFLMKIEQYCTYKFQCDFSLCLTTYHRLFFLHLLVDQLYHFDGCGISFQLCYNMLNHVFRVNIQVVFSSCFIQHIAEYTYVYISVNFFSYFLWIDVQNFLSHLNFIFLRLNALKKPFRLLINLTPCFLDVTVLYFLTQLGQNRSYLALELFLCNSHHKRG